MSVVHARFASETAYLPETAQAQAVELINFCRERNFTLPTQMVEFEGDPLSVLAHIAQRLPELTDFTPDRYDALLSTVADTIADFTGAMTSGLLSCRLTYQNTADDMPDALKSGYTHQRLAFAEDGRMVNTGIQGKKRDLTMLGSGYQTDDSALFMRLSGKRHVMIDLLAKAGQDDRAQEAAHMLDMLKPFIAELARAPEALRQLAAQLAAPPQNLVVAANGALMLPPAIQQALAALSQDATLPPALLQALLPLMQHAAQLTPSVAPLAAAGAINAVPAATDAKSILHAAKDGPTPVVKDAASAAAKPGLAALVLDALATLGRNKNAAPGLAAMLTTLVQNPRLLAPQPVLHVNALAAGAKTDIRLDQTVPQRNAATDFATQRPSIKTALNVLAVPPTPQAARYAPVATPAGKLASLAEIRGPQTALRSILPILEPTTMRVVFAPPRADFKPAPMVSTRADTVVRQTPVAQNINTPIQQQTTPQKEAPIVQQRAEAPPVARQAEPAVPAVAEAAPKVAQNAPQPGAQPLTPPIQQQQPTPPAAEAPKPAEAVKQEPIALQPPPDGGARKQEATKGPETVAPADTQEIKPQDKGIRKEEPRLKEADPVKPGDGTGGTIPNPKREDAVKPEKHKDDRGDAPEAADKKKGRGPDNQQDRDAEAKKKTPEKKEQEPQKIKVEVKVEDKRVEDTKDKKDEKIKKPKNIKDCTDCDGTKGCCIDANKVFGELPERTPEQQADFDRRRAAAEARRAQAAALPQLKVAA